MAHFHLGPADLAFAGAGDRFQKNLAALRLLHHLTTTSRLATDDERRILAHYSAFGESALPAYALFVTTDAGLLCLLRPGGICSWAAFC